MTREYQGLEIEHFTGMLKDLRAKNTTDRLTDFEIANNAKEKDLVEFLADKANSEENKARFLDAAKEGHTKTVTALIREGVNVDAVDTQKCTALMYAAVNGRTGTVKALIDKGADVDIANKNEWTALMIAAQNGHAATVKALIEKGAKVGATTNNGWIALMFAAENGHTEIVNDLIEKGANIDATNKNGMTALMLAAQNGHTATVKALIEKKAKVGAATKNGWTALMFTAENGHTNTVTALIAAGVNVNAANEHKETALIIAAENGHTNTVTALIAKGADVNAVDKDERTALMLAAENGFGEIVKALIAKGANIDATNKNGRTARMIAAENYHGEEITNAIIDALLENPERIDNLKLSKKEDIEIINKFINEEITALGIEGFHIEGLYAEDIADEQCENGQALKIVKNKLKTLSRYSQDRLEEFDDFLTRLVTFTNNPGSGDFLKALKSEELIIDTPESKEAYDLQEGLIKFRDLILDNPTKLNKTLTTEGEQKELPEAFKAQIPKFLCSGAMIQYALGMGSEEEFNSLRGSDGKRLRLTEIPKELWVMVVSQLNTEEMYSLLTKAAQKRKGKIANDQDGDGGNHVSHPSPAPASTSAGRTKPPSTSRSGGGAAKGGGGSAGGAGGVGGGGRS